MKIFLAIAAGLLATGASAQTTTTVTRTQTTPSHTMNSTRVVERTHVSARNVPVATRRRVCTTKWRNHRRIRTCRTVVRR